jgi:hypothetical protein
MSQILQCPSCGGSNQMPDGRNSMFCAFCGTVVQAQIQQPFSAANNSSLLSKPNITVKSFKGNTPWFQSSGERRVDGGIEYWDKIRDKWVFIEDEKERTLTLTDRNISSIEEITSWFSDNELEEIDILNLSNNNITSLKGIERFKGLKELDLSKNRIPSLSGLNKLCVSSLKLNLSDNCFEILDDMVRFNVESTSSSTEELIINLSNNLVLKDISDDVVNSLNSNSNYFYNLSFDFEGCKEFDIQLINKINFRNILIKENTTDDDTINCFVSITSPLCTDYAPQLIANNNSTKSDSNDNISNSNTRDKSNKPNIIQNIFGRLNILDWIALVAPIILATIISQSDSNKDSGLGFWDFLLGFLVLAIIFRFYPFFSRKEKTGRSFESKHGTLHEYRTVEGKVNTEHGFWIVSLIHVITIALIIYFHGFGSSKSENQTNTSDTSTSQPQDNSHSNEISASQAFCDTTSKYSAENQNFEWKELSELKTKNGALKYYGAVGWGKDEKGQIYALLTKYATNEPNSNFLVKYNGEEWEEIGGNINYINGKKTYFGGCVIKGFNNHIYLTGSIWENANDKYYTSALFDWDGSNWVIINRNANATYSWSKTYKDIFYDKFEFNQTQKIYTNNDGKLIEIGDLKSDKYTGYGRIVYYDINLWRALLPLELYKEALDIAFDENNNLYILCRNFENGKGFYTVLMWDGKSINCITDSYKSYFRISEANYSNAIHGVNLEGLSYRNGKLYMYGRNTGENGIYNILVWNGSSWEIIGEEDFQGFNTSIYSINCEKNGFIYALTHSESNKEPYYGIIWRFDGSKWEEVLGEDFRARVNDGKTFSKDILFDSNNNIYLFSEYSKIYTTNH